MICLVADSTDPKTVMIDATCLAAHRTACSLWAKRRVGARSVEKGLEGKRNCPVDSVGQKRNPRLPAIADAKGRPIGLYISAGQVCEYTGPSALLGRLPKAGWILAAGG